MEWWNNILQWDTDALIWARTIIDSEYARVVQFLAELIVIWGAVFHVCLWLTGTKTKNNVPKITSLHIAFLIFTVF